MFSIPWVLTSRQGPDVLCILSLISTHQARKADTILNDRWRNWSPDRWGNVSQVPRVDSVKASSRTHVGLIIKLIHFPFHASNNKNTNNCPIMKTKESRPNSKKVGFLEASWEPWGCPREEIIHSWKSHYVWKHPGHFIPCDLVRSKQDQIWREPFNGGSLPPLTVQVQRTPKCSPWSSVLYNSYKFDQDANTKG